MNSRDSTQRVDYEKDLWELERRHRSSRRLERVFALYSVFGLIIGVTGLAFFFVERIDFSLKFEERVSLMLAGIGFFVSVLSFAFLYLRKQEYSEDLERSKYISAASEFLLQWAGFENASGSSLTSGTNDFNRYSIRDVLGRLFAEGKISAADAAALEEAIRFRNLLVHGGKQVDPNHLARMTETVRDIASRLASTKEARAA